MIKYNKEMFELLLINLDLEDCYIFRNIINKRIEELKNDKSIRTF